MIRRVAIRNYRVFRHFDLELAPDVNIIVGRNDPGESTLIEAIHLALTRRLHGSWFDHAHLVAEGAPIPNCRGTHETQRGRINSS